jgi:hypothetical protein
LRALQYSTDNVTFSPVTSTAITTNANGAYTFKGAVTTAGTYYYRAYYAGSTQYGEAYSAMLKVTIQ